MIVDCDRCVVRGNACQDCVITVLFGAPPGGVELDGAERRALDTLAEVGMVPRLQLVARGKDHSSIGHGGTQTGPCEHRGAERSTNSDERSSRRVC